MSVERLAQAVGVRSCSTVPYARSPQFPFQHNDGFQPGKRVDTHAKNHVIRVAVVVILRDGLP